MAAQSSSAAGDAHRNPRRWCTTVPVGDEVGGTTSQQVPGDRVGFTRVLMGHSVAVRQIQVLVGVQALCALLASVSVCQTCPGDCDGLGTVTVTELVKGVNIAIGQQNLSACPAFDSDSSGAVSIAELVAAVHAALFGCGPSVSTPTPTMTAAKTATASPTVTVACVEPSDLLLSGRVAEDRTLYYLLSARGSASTCSVEAIRVTSLGASIAGTDDCAAVGNMSGGLASAIGGVLPPGQVLHPYEDTLRTRVLHPSGDLIRFSGAGSGRVMLGSGAGPINVCAADGDCVGAPGVSEALYTLDATPGEPPACIANASPECAAQEVFEFFAFGAASAGSPPVCRSPETDVTVDTKVCAPTPTDGFTLRPGDVVVLAFGRGQTLRGFSFSVAAAGFTSAPSGAPLVCEANQVLRPVAVIDSIIVPP